MFLKRMCILQLLDAEFIEFIVTGMFIMFFKFDSIFLKPVLSFS